MSTKIFVNLPVKDLAASIAFFTSLGYSFNEQFTDDKAGSLVISDDIYAMLVTEPYFATFTGKKATADTADVTEAILALGLDSRAEVDRIIEAAFAAGGEPVKDTEDLGFMYSRSFYDLDGHHWEFFHMDLAAMPQG